VAAEGNAAPPTSLFSGSPAVDHELNSLLSACGSGVTIGRVASRLLSVAGVAALWKTSFLMACPAQ
jgi:hypothetical protein